MLAAQAPATAPADPKVPQLDRAGTEAMIAVLEQERESRAAYQAILDERRPIHPFGRVLREEFAHENSLVAELERLGIPVPDDSWADKDVDVPADDDRARQIAVRLESRTIAAYDEAIKAVSDPATKRLLRQFRSDSRHHLRMFEMACGDSTGAGMGPAPGMGRGRGTSRR
jgi:hypothetical protein